jgi:hypothetical protein
MFLYTPSTAMFFPRIIIAILSTLTLTSTALNSSFPSSIHGDTNPFRYPLTNGFPKIDFKSTNYTSLLTAAHGSGPKSKPPPTLSPLDLPSLQLIAFHQLYSTAFYTSLLHNITTNSAPFFIPSAATHATLQAALTSIQAQEQLHFLTANGALQFYNSSPIAPCTYRFPTTDLPSALTLAQTFTDLIIGTLSSIQTHFAQNGDSGLVAIVGAMIANKAAQTGYLRALRSLSSLSSLAAPTNGQNPVLVPLTPAALPFPTGGARTWAYSWLLQHGVVPGSCPTAAEHLQVNLPVLPRLDLVGPPPVEARNQTLRFAFVADVLNATTSTTITQNPPQPPPPPAAPPAEEKGEQMFVVYINSQNSPLALEATCGDEASTSDGGYGARHYHYCSASFPAGAYSLNGLTIAVLTHGGGPFVDAEAVADASVAGPVLIEIR